MELLLYVFLIEFLRKIFSSVNFTSFTLKFTLFYLLHYSLYAPMDTPLRRPFGDDWAVISNIVSQAPGLSFGAAVAGNVWPQRPGTPLNFKAVASSTGTGTSCNMAPRLKRAGVLAKYEPGAHKFSATVALDRGNEVVADVSAMLAPRWAPGAQLGAKCLGLVTHSASIPGPSVGFSVLDRTVLLVHRAPKWKAMASPRILHLECSTPRFARVATPDGQLLSPAEASPSSGSWLWQTATKLQTTVRPAPRTGSPVDLALFAKDPAAPYLAPYVAAGHVSHVGFEALRRIPGIVQLGGVPVCSTAKLQGELAVQAQAQGTWFLPTAQRHAAAKAVYNLAKPDGVVMAEKRERVEKPDGSAGFVVQRFLTDKFRARRRITMATNLTVPLARGISVGPDRPQWQMLPGVDGTKIESSVACGAWWPFGFGVAASYSMAAGLAGSVGARWENDGTVLKSVAHHNGTLDLSAAKKMSKPLRAAGAAHGKLQGPYESSGTLKVGAHVDLRSGVLKSWYATLALLAQ